MSGYHPAGGHIFFFVFVLFLAASLFVARPFFPTPVLLAGCQLAGCQFFYIIVPGCQLAGGQGFLVYVFFLAASWLVAMVFFLVCFSSLVIARFCLVMFAYLLLELVRCCFGFPDAVNTCCLFHVFVYRFLSPMMFWKSICDVFLHHHQTLIMIEVVND